MTTFTVLIEDETKLAGITAARNAYNESNASSQDFVPMTDDSQYVQFVMDGASASYAHQHKV